MQSLLQCIEQITSCRDRGSLPRALACSVAEVLGGGDVGVFFRDPQGEVSLKMVSGTEIANSSAPEWLEFIEETLFDSALKTREILGRNCAAIKIPPSELSTDQMVLAFDVGQGDPAAQTETIATLVRIYGGQISLIDYAELDSLTRLLNRKTFEETFDRLLMSPAQESTDIRFDKRRNSAEDGMPAWLCVIDIDHFKRVNDTFGHLFGDEVLLRVGELMRKTFRGGDRLFRFGGEEFVVILNAANEEQAAVSFNRFRTSVEAHEFPQVGQVTCSIGFTGVSGMDVPTDVVGRADEALYFAKENGRNQVCCYEALVAEGLIAKPVPAEAPVAEDFDIDALFG